MMIDSLRDRLWPVERKWLEFRNWLGDKIAGSQCEIRCRDCGSCGHSGCCGGNTCGYIRCRFGKGYEDDLSRTTKCYFRMEAFAHKVASRGNSDNIDERLLASDAAALIRDCVDIFRGEV